jgi:RNA recognition motif-containing protein
MNRDDEDFYKRTIFIGGFVPEKITYADLAALVDPFGAVEEIRWPRDNNRLRSFCFVTFVEEQSAQLAVRQLRGVRFGGKLIGVDPARPREPKKPESSTS